MASGSNDRPTVEPASRADWRAWLAEHHADVPSAWVAIGKKGNRVTTLTYDEAVEEALCFGWIDSLVHRLDDDRFVQLFTPRKPRSAWSPSNKERVERLIAQGLMRPAGLAAIKVAKANGSWDMYERRETLDVPDDLAEALARTPDAAEKFAALPPGKRRLALAWISDAKRDETRRKRISATVEAAAQGRGVM